MKDRILALVGASGSGKTTIAERLEKEGFNYIQNYTTRPQRHDSECGHIFVTESDYEETPKEDIIAYTYYNNNHYWAEKSQYKGKGTSIYVIDPKGVDELQEKNTDAEIIVIYLMAEELTRYSRMVSRAKPAEDGKKVVERLKYDKEAFKTVRCHYAIDANGTVDEVLEEVKKVIGCWKF